MPEGEINVEELLAEIKPREKTVRVLLRQDLHEQHAALREQLAAAASEAGDSIVTSAPAIAKQIVELEQEMDDARVPFTFRGIGRRRWRDLLAEHPPTKAQLTQAREQRIALDHDPDKFQAAAIQASCVSPKMTLLQVHQFNERMDIAEWNTLWAACLEVCIGDQSTPKALEASRILRLSGESAITAARAELLDPSSSAGLSDPGPGDPATSTTTDE